MSVEKEKLLLKDYIQKDVTQQSEFLEKYPECDGRGLLIAILDSGVDVGFDGMQKTTTDLPKVVDCFDFTGAGKVDTLTIKESDESNHIVGLSGRVLKIPLCWKNPSGKWHLGVKSIYELCSDSVLKRIIEKRKELIIQQNEALKENIDVTDDENYKTMMEYLKMTEDLSKDSLVADCIVWFNGEKWQACIATSFIGDFQCAKVLTNYNDEHEYDKICDALTYCIKIHNDGHLLQIFSTIYDHGTLIAHVAAAFFPDKPERNGLAPGAQIVSMKVSSCRKGWVEQGKTLLKAYQKCIEMKVDIINCSFGGPAREFKTKINKMAEKHGILYFQSAGNHGCIYSSVNQHNSLFKDAFIIGSVSMQKMENEISYEIPYYSSRGPDYHGGRGIDFVASGDLSSGKYFIITYISQNSLSPPDIPPVEDLPEITITLDLCESYKPNIYSNSKRKNDSKFTSKKLIDLKKEGHEIYFKQIPIGKLPLLLSSNITFHGSANFINDAIQISVPISHQFTLQKKAIAGESLTIEKNKNDKIPWLLMEELFDLLPNNVTPNYSINNCIKKTMENIKSFINELRNGKSDVVLKQIDNLNISSSKSKRQIGIPNDVAICDSVKLNQCVLDDAAFERKDFDEIISSTTNEYSNLINRVNVSKQPKLYSSNFSPAEIDEFTAILENLEDGTIQKDLTPIIFSLLSGNFGTALLNLNKLSTKNQTKPAFKFVDLAIIELLKHFKWDHLVEAHQHALLDRHRDYCRSLCY